MAGGGEAAKVGRCEELAVQSPALGAAARASPGSLPEIQNLHPSPTDSVSTSEQGPQAIPMHLKI